MSKKGTNKDKDFSDYLKSIECNAKKLTDCEDPSVQTAAANIIGSVKEMSAAIKGVQNMLIFAAVLTLVATVAATLFGLAYFDRHIEGTVANTEKKILYPGSQDTLIYRSTNGKIVTYKQLDIQNDSLLKRSSQLQDSLDDINFKLNLAIKAYDLVFTTKKLKEGSEITVSSGLINSYQKMIDEQVVQDKKNMEELNAEVERLKKSISNVK